MVSACIKKRDVRSDTVKFFNMNHLRIQQSLIYLEHIGICTNGPTTKPSRYWTHLHPEHLGYLSRLMPRLVINRPRASYRCITQACQMSGSGTVALLTWSRMFCSFIHIFHSDLENHQYSCLFRLFCFLGYRGTTRRLIDGRIGTYTQWKQRKRLRATLAQCF